jgi:hypothetical protein
MECFGTTDFDNNSRLITLSAIIISGLHCVSYLGFYRVVYNEPVLLNNSEQLCKTTQIRYILFFVTQPL